jgi:hypothetical protein
MDVVCRGCGSFGRNQFGQLGLAHTDDVLRSTAIPSFAEVEVLDAACGALGSNSAALGVLFSSG